MRRTLAATALVAAMTLAPAGAGWSVLAAEEDGPVSATVEGFGPEVLSPGQSLSAAVTITNAATTPATDIWVEMWVTTGPLSSADALGDFLDNPHETSLREAVQVPEQPEPVEVDEEADEEVEPEEPEGASIVGRGSLSVSVSATDADLGLPADAWGVYGLVIQLRAGDTIIPVDALPVTWTDAEVPELELAVLAQATGSDARMEAVLGASAIEGVAVALDPSLVTNALVFDQDLLEREVLPVPAGTPDVTSLAHAADEQILAQALATPPGTTLGGVDRNAWIATPAAIDALSVGYAAANGAAASIALATADGHAEAAEGGTVRSVDGATVLVADATLSSTLESYRPGTPAARAVLVAYSALAADAADGEPLLVAPGTLWQLGVGGVSQPLEALVDAPWTTVVPVADLMGADGEALELEGTRATEQDLPAADIEQLGDAIDSLRTLATTTDRPDAALADWADPVVRAVPQAMRDLPTARGELVSEALTATDETLAGVRIAESSDLNLLANEGDIPVTIVNELDWPVTVTVDLRSLSPSLNVQDRPVVTIPAQQELVAPVTVEAVSSGNVGVTVILRTSTGVAVSDAQSFDVRIRADWGTAATAVFSVLLVLLLIAGLIRTVRRGRKDTRTSPQPAPATAPSSLDEPDGSDGSDDEPRPDEPQPDEPQPGEDSEDGSVREADAPAGTPPPSPRRADADE
ncbi:DUF6049 family protein [Demequina sp. NBRC 110056]|uniref:DUF6049 family protein n=1 Tax=Demequina sp. NBRC 110056 TaxID=1570345 RepID=UPI00135664E8|nr:DUF6049 family protein [Demequina sp. NBRC 110056]